MLGCPRTIARTCSSFALWVGLAGCDPGPAPSEPTDELSERAWVYGHSYSGGYVYRMNTNHAGPHFFSELHLGGAEHEGTRLIEILYDEPCGSSTCTTPVITQTVQVLGGELHAELVDGRTIRHTDFGQTRWTIDVTGSAAGASSGYFSTSYELTVEASWDAGSAQPTYMFFWDDGWGEGAESTCTIPGETTEMTAVVYPGVDVHEPSGSIHETPELLTIACTGGAVGKAALWGYRPDDLAASHGSDGVGIFEASVRMIRADYCGDGQSWTSPGTPVLVEDNLGINGPLPSVWLPGQSSPADEAVWDRYGAVCLAVTRVPNTIVSCQDGTVVWPCFFGTATAFADPAALFRTQIP